MFNPRIILLCIFLFCVSFSYAFVVNQSVDVQLTVQHDDGVTLTPVLVQACVGSVYDYPSASLIVRDVNLTAGNPFHNFSFLPVDVGSYGISVRCAYLNESATYFEIISVVNPTTASASGGQLLVLNTDIRPSRDFFTVNLLDNPSLTFPTNYYVNDKLRNANIASWSVLKDNKLLKRGDFQILSEGVYQFDNDFTGYATGDDYEIDLTFDGRVKIIGLTIISKPVGGNALSGYFIDPYTGGLDKTKVVIAIIIILILIVLLYLIIRWFNHRGDKKKSKLYKGQAP